MYSSIYRVQSSTRRLPIQALLGFTLKLVKSYFSPPPQSLCVVVCPWYPPWVASLVHLVSAKFTLDTYLFPIWSSLPLLSIPVSDPLTLSPSLGLFSCPCSIFLPSLDPPFPLSPFIGVYLSPYILTYISSIYKALYSI